MAGLSLVAELLVQVCQKQIFSNLSVPDYQFFDTRISLQIVRVDCEFAH